MMMMKRHLENNCGVWKQLNYSTKHNKHKETENWQNCQQKRYQKGIPGAPQWPAPVTAPDGIHGHLSHDNPKLPIVNQN